MCPLQPNFSIPYAVSIVSRVRYPPSNLLVVVNNYNETKSNNKFAVCVKPLHFDYNRVSKSTLVYYVSNYKVKKLFEMQIQTIKANIIYIHRKTKQNCAIFYLTKLMQYISCTLFTLEPQAIRKHKL